MKKTLFTIRYWAYTGNHPDGRDQDRAGDESAEVMKALGIKSKDSDDWAALFNMQRDSPVKFGQKTVTLKKSRRWNFDSFGCEVELKYKIE